MRQRLRAAWLVPPILLLASLAAAQTVDVEIGYRWTDIEGNEDLYRTQINEQDGVLIRSLSFFTTDFNGATASATDNFRIDATDLGAGPVSALRIETGKTGTYRLTLGYRSFDTFSALPAFANPLLEQGVIPGQHTYDRDRTLFDVDLEILPNASIVPFIGYSLNRNDGPGTTTYTIGQDEFLLRSNLDESDREIRVGAAFNLKRISGVITQGWRSLSSEEELTLAPGAGGGNNGGPVLGQPVTAETIRRNSDVDVDTPFTNLYVMGNATQRVLLIGEFVRFGADSDSREDEISSGSFVSFPLRSSFASLVETIDGSGENDTWRGGVRAEITLTDRMTILANYEKESQELGGSALINSLFRNAIAFGGSPSGDIEQVLQSNNSMDRDQDAIGAAFSARALGPFSLRVAVRRTTQDVSVSPDLSEIVVPGNQGGDFDRSINSYDISGNYTRSLLTAGASWRGDRADNAILRTDFVDRDRFRLRAGVHTPNNLLRAGITLQQIDRSNDQPGINYDAETRQYVADVEVVPLTSLRFHASYSQLRAESTMTIRRPENFALDTSFHEEDGDAVEAGVALLFRGVSAEASFGRFENEGSIPFTTDRYRVRAAYDFKTNVGVIAEWSRDTYDEAPAYGQFDANRFGLFIRWRR